jgi:hypothetical protein
MQWIIILFLASMASALFAAEPIPARAKQNLAEIQRILPKSAPWDKWIADKGVLPPDFDMLPSVPYLPDPLKFKDGKDVKRDDWTKRRQELLKLFEEYVIGSCPPAPANLRPLDLKTHEEEGCFIDDVVLEFGPSRKARLRLEVIIPKGRGPFPVFITQMAHRSWGLVAVSRGYIACMYAGSDGQDDTEAWPEVWPENDWSKLTRRAWAVGRCIDYLSGMPAADRGRIALAGHSRNAKTSLIAAAIDLRISAVISSSSGAGGACSYRLFSEAEFGEGIELMTRNFPDWLHPKLRFFAGRENKLPVDQPELIACIAPRPCLISSAINDNVESVWAVEQTCASVHRVYELLERPDNLFLRYRNGGHEIRSEDIEGYMDWLDTVFGRVKFPLPDAPIYPTYTMWQNLSGEKIDPLQFPTNDIHDLLNGPDGAMITTLDQWQQKRPVVRDHMTWGLGAPPPYAAATGGNSDLEARHVALLLKRDSVPNGLQKTGVNFGNDLAGDLYFPTNADKSGQKMPAVVWLHPISNPDGYVAGYGRGEAVHTAMARLGFAVLAFDQIGNGSRVQEVRNFYLRYPNWSLIGKDVTDTMAAVGTLQKLPFIDSTRIFLVGYGPGAMVALHAAALNEQIAGVVSVAGFTPMRRNTLNKGTGGLGRWSLWMPFEPRLGAFIQNETRVPYDYHEVLALVAPRPVLVFAPRIDYHATLEDVRECMDEASKIYNLYGVGNHLQFFELDDYNRFSPESQKIIFEKLKLIAGLTEPAP